MTSTVLVTGGSGFIAGHTILALLEKGYAVRTTVRSDASAHSLEKTLAGHGANTAGLSFAHADLLSDEGWADAAAGCHGVLHMASPFPLDMPDDPQTIIRPAVEGTLRVLRAAAGSGARRVVLTSSLVAISYGRGGRDTPFTEDDWTDPEGKDVTPYVQSKTLAERAAWDFMATHGGEMTLSVVNPGVVLGPLLSATHGTSVEIVRKMMAGELPGAARLGFCVVDVRDVADLHIRALKSDQAAGHRFICADRWMWLKEIGASIRAQFPVDGRKAPTRQLPSVLVRLLSVFDPSIRQILIELDQKRAVDNSRARAVLGWSPRSADDAIQATGESLKRFGLV